MAADNNPAFEGQLPLSAPSRPLKPHACVLCQQRKVKCDRKGTYPCSVCTKARVDCIFRPPAPPRRRKRRNPEEILLARLQRYERLLQSHGIQFDNPEDENLQPTVPANSENDVKTPSTGYTMHDFGDPTESSESKLDKKFGRLIVEEGKSKFLENNLWMSLSDELRNPGDIFEDESASDSETTYMLEQHASGRRFQNMNHFVFGFPAEQDIYDLHPEPVQIFIDNINPLTKLCHVPTVQQEIIQRSANLRNMPRATEALMFAIYTCSVTSLTDEDCQSTFGELRSALLRRLRYGTRQALINANFLRSSDVVVLRAFVLYIMAMRRYSDPQNLSMLTGMAMRIAQRIGLHRDGASLGLSVFDTEMRRRLWWQMIILDGHTSHMSGLGTSIMEYKWDTEIPLNINDSDLNVDSKEAPAEYARPTEMLFCRLRCEVGRFFRRQGTTWGSEWPGLGNARSQEQKKKAVDELENLLEERYLQYCDLSIPFHLVTWAVGRSVIAVMRLSTHQIRKHGIPTSSRGQNTAEDDAIFMGIVKYIEYDNMAHSNPSLKPFRWHVDVHFQWHSFIYLLSELRTHTDGPEVEEAWSQVALVFENRPQILDETKNALHVAIGNLALKAWDSRERALLAVSGARDITRPKFVEVLRTQRSSGAPLAGSFGQPANTTNLNSLNTGYPSSGAQHTQLVHNPDGAATVDERFDSNIVDPNTLSASLGPIETGKAWSPVNWEQWDTLLEQFESQQNMESMDMDPFTY